MVTDMYPKLLRLLFIIAIFLGLFFTIKYTFIYIYPFLIAFFIAFILNPIITYIHTNWRLNRTFATALMMICFFVLLFSSLFFIVRRLILESSTLLQTLPEQLDQLKLTIANLGQNYLLPLYEKWTTYIPFFPPFEELSFNDYLDGFFDEIGQLSLSLLSNFIGSASNLFSSITYIVTIVIFVLLATFMLMKDFETIKPNFRSVIPRNIANKFSQIQRQMKKSVFGFIKAQITLTLISTIIIFIGLAIFRVDHLFLTTLIIFLVDFIPYVGIGIIFIPWIVYSFFIDQYVLTLELSILYIVVIIIRQVLEPKILASSIGIHPLVALFILFIGIQSLGFIGIFITPIILIVLSAIYHAGIFHFLWDFVKNG